MDGILAVTSYVIYPWLDAMPAQNKKCLNMKYSKHSRLVLLLMIISSDGLNIGGRWILVCEMTSAVLVVLLPVLVVSAGVLECTGVGTDHSHQLSPAPAVSGWRSLVTVHWSPRSLRPLNMADLEYKKQETRVFLMWEYFMMSEWHWSVNILYHVHTLCERLPSQTLNE